MRLVKINIKFAINLSLNSWAFQHHDFLSGKRWFLHVDKFYLKDSSWQFSLERRPEQPISEADAIREQKEARGNDLLVFIIALTSIYSSLADRIRSKWLFYILHPSIIIWPDVSRRKTFWTNFDSDLFLSCSFCLNWL